MKAWVNSEQIETAWRKNDTNAPSERIPVSELIFYGVKEHTVPKFVIQHYISNHDTIRFIESAKSSFELRDGVRVCASLLNLMRHVTDSGGMRRSSGRTANGFPFSLDL